jgi:hypothetical protein
MCSIICSYKKDVLENLIDINQFRGNFSFSYTEIGKHPEIQVKGWGDFEKDIIRNNDLYKITHVQAPTGGIAKDFSRIHPTIIEDTMLWHNGILTPRGITYCQKKLNTSEGFDTLLLHRMILEHGFESLSEIEGLFSCVYFNKEVYMFRTKHGKLYIDDDKNISSEEFKDSRCIYADRIYRVDTLEVVDTFKTKRFNFIIPGRL